MRREIRSYVLRPGRITRLQQRSLESLSAAYCVPFGRAPLDLAALFPAHRRVVAEIGFGMGGATAAIAQSMPDTGFLGIEVFRAGVGKLLSEIERLGLGNVKILNHDAAEVFAWMIPGESLDGIHLFFPDPWPKKRHHKRRLLQPPFAGLLARALRKGGYLYVVTDWEDYALEILDVLSRLGPLANRYEEGFASPQDWRPTTTFERKGRAGNRAIRELYFTKS